MIKPNGMLYYATLLLLAVILITGAGWQAGQWARSEMEASLDGRLDVYARSLEATLERFGHLPDTIALDPAVIRLAELGTVDPSLAAQVNRYLKTVSSRTAAPVLYLIGRDGTTLAASNWDEPGSYVGVNFSYRPYFQQALAGRAGHFYGVGTVTGIPGYFIAAPVISGDAVVGVTVVKVLLDDIVAAWQASGAIVLLADRNGVVFESSYPGWKLRSIRPLDGLEQAVLARTRQYGGRQHEPLPFTVEDDRALPDLVQGDVEGGRYLLERHRLERDGWSLLLLLDARPIARAQSTGAGIMTLLLALAAAAGLARRQRRRRLDERERSRAALEQAHLDLERKVHERTADLSAANRRLESEVDQRRQTEQELRAAQNELVQTAKMAVLGQMAAGVTHELNQPLTALRGLADNTVELLNRGRAAEVRENMGFIVRLVDRMTTITAQLRGFSRRSDGEAQPVALAPTVREALALVERRLVSDAIAVDLGLPPDTLLVLFDAVRLQQIIVNLLRNAADALRGRSDARIWMTVIVKGGLVEVSVADNGPGIEADILPRLFDPFFTTKPAGEGLGLGLAISQAIARDYSARLTAANRPGGGAIFTLTLPAFASHENINAG